MGRITGKYDSHLLREHYGVFDPMPPELRLKVGKAVLCVAGADGELSTTEMNHFLGVQRAMGATDDMLEQWLKFDYRGQRLGDFLDKETEPYARIVLYDALRTARADKVQALERDAAVRMAKLLHVDPATVPAIEGLMGIEDALNAARIRVLSPVQGPGSAP